jgi:hypothetical protein
MFCTDCHLPVERDDVVTAYDDGWCRCLPCHGRNTGARRTVPMGLRRELESILKAIDATSEHR